MFKIINIYFDFIKIYSHEECRDPELVILIFKCLANASLEPSNAKFMIKMSVD